MRVLITGVHGFVGSNLVNYLAQPGSLFFSGYTIYGLDIISPEKTGVAQTFSWEDLDAGRIPEVDAIIHLAGMAHDTKNQTAAEVYFKVNRDLTVKVYDYFCAHPQIKKFVFFSTAKAAADRVEGVLTEDVVPAPGIGGLENRLFSGAFTGREASLYLAAVHDSRSWEQGELEPVVQYGPQRDPLAVGGLRQPADLLLGGKRLLCRGRSSDKGCPNRHLQYGG